MKLETQEKISCGEMWQPVECRTIMPLHVWLSVGCSVNWLREKTGDLI